MRHTLRHSKIEDLIKKCELTKLDLDKSNDDLCAFIKSKIKINDDDLIFIDISADTFINSFYVDFQPSDGIVLINIENQHNYRIDLINKLINEKGFLTFQDLQTTSI